MPAAGFKEFSYSDVNPFWDGQNREAAESVLMASGQASGITPTFRHPPGTVLIKKTGDGKFYLADDQVNADSPAPASVTALETADDDWEDSTLTIKGHWGEETVTLAATDDTDSEVAAAINAHFAALDPEWGPVVASVSGSRVVVTNRDTGHGTWLHVIHNGVTTAFGANGTGDNGTDPIVVVTVAPAELQDANGTAQDFFVQAVRRANFITANLSSLTAEARGILENRGSKFFPLGA